MKVSAINRNISFGKQQLMTCSVKDKENQKRHDATLYKLDPMNENDRKDVYYSYNAQCIAYDFFSEWIKPKNIRDFYLLQNDKTGEVISCAQTMHKCKRLTDSHTGIYTLIEEANENPKYVNGAEPLLAYIVKTADEKCDESVFTSFDTETVKALKHSKFSETKTGEYYIPQKRFPILVNQAEKRYQIDFDI